jgi:RNA polymerase sigma factor (sigma-70 family)
MRTLNGDKGAFAVIVEKYKNTVFAITLKILHHYEDAEDAAQEALIKLWRSLPSYRFECPILPYALQIAKNAVLDLLRREHVHRENTVSMVREENEGEAVELDEDGAYTIKRIRKDAKVEVTFAEIVEDAE